MDFDEWMAKNYSGDFDMPHPRDAYEAGQQSKRAEIDALKAKIDEFVSIVHDAYMSDGNSSVEIVYDKIQELLK